ncbi:MAG: leucine-rich repeat domain-containing protein [Paludibacteraceae bacterium]|nr:leucine-rich repeat domain-containing protein [Paludibacteraceae bacterium]
MKKILLFLTTLLFAIEWVAADVTAGKFLINRNTSNNTAEINGLSDDEKGVCKNSSNQYTLVIPASISYQSVTYKVTEIADRAFDPGSNGDKTSCYNNIKIVDLSNATNLTTIGEKAFNRDDSWHNRNISQIKWPTSGKLTTIKSQAFKNCMNVTSLDLPEGLKTIGDEAFALGSGAPLASISIPSTITSLSSIGKDAFIPTTGTHSLTINSKDIVEADYSSSTKTISTIFPRTESITFSSKVTKIGNYAFDGCSNLSSIDLNNVTSIGTNAFRGCTALTTIDLRKLVSDTNIDHVGLETIRITTTNTTNITNTRAKNLIFGSNITSIASNFFTENVSYAVESVTFENTNGVDISDNAFGGPIGKIRNFGKLKTVIGKIKSVGDHAFYNNTSQLGPLTTIDLSSATSIGSNAFYRQALTSVNLANVKNVSVCAFEDCSNLTSIGNLNNAEEIGERAFKGTALSIEELNLSKSNSIGAEAFSGQTINKLTVSGDVAETAFSTCTGLEEVTVNSETVANPTKVYTPDNNISRYFGSNVKKFVFNTTTVGDNVLTTYPEVTTLVFGSKVNSVGDAAASLCPNLTTVTFNKGSGTVNVGQVAFTGCSKLTTVSGKIGTLGTGAFGLCTSLNNVDFKNSTLDIPQEAFSGDVALKTINNVTVGNVGNQAFNGCTAFTGENMVFSGTTTLGAGAFKNCKSLKKIPCTDVVNIGDETFNGCSSMSVSESALSKVKTIGNKAFKDCDGIDGPYGFTLPASIESIGDEAFKGSYMYISTLNLTGNNLKSLGKDAFIVGSLNIDCPTYLAQDFTTTNNVLSSVKFQSGSELTIGPSVTAIGDNAFNNTASEKIEIKNRILIDSKNLTSLGNNSFKGLKTETFYITPSSAQVNADKIKVEAKNLSIHSHNFNIIYIDENNNFLKAFSDSLENVNILNNYDDMAYIPRYAFYTTEGNKTNLKSISGYYYGVGYYAFANNQNLKSVNFELLQYIQSHAFENCSGLEIVNISNDNEKEPVVIEEYAFKGNSLKVITVHRGKIKPGARGDETCNSITVSPTAFEGQKPWLLMDMSDQVNVECNENTKVITNTEAKANEYRNRATNAPRYVTSIQRMECNPADVNMDNAIDGRDAQAIFNSMH